MIVEGSTIIITGGASGLGEGTARFLSKLGAKCVLLDRNDETGPTIAADIGGLFLKTDITDEASVQDAIKTTIEKYGYIHAVVNCAGVAAAKKVSDRFGTHPLGIFEKVIQVNLTGTFNVCRLVIEAMVKQPPNENGERGVIINTASVAAFDGQQGQAAYAASKGGVVSMTLPLARELGPHGIRVMTIAPGMFDTPMTSALPDRAREAILKTIPFPKRFGGPTDFGRLCASILENPLLNGEVIRLDGALRLPML